MSKKRFREQMSLCRKKDTHQICHQFGVGDENGPLDGDDVMCRGFYETQPLSQMLRIAERLNYVRFVDQPLVEDKK